MAKPTNRKKRRANASAHHPPFTHGPSPHPTTWERKVRMVVFRWYIKSRDLLVKAKDTVRAFSTWIRATGIVGLLVGGASLIKVFYILSVCAIYAGLVLLLLDVYFEKLPALGKFVISCVILGAGLWFTHNIVLRRSPIKLEYEVYANAIDFEVRNDSFTDDYDDLDLTITVSPAPATVFVGETKFLTSNPNCYFVREAGLIPNGHRSVVEVVPGGVVDWPDMVRVRCSKVPRQSSVRMRAMTHRETSDHKMISAAPNAVPLALGQFVGLFKVVKVNQKLELVGNP